MSFMDLRMPKADGIAAIRMILEAHPEARIIALTSYGNADIYRALDAGACGYLIKDMLGTQVVNAVRTAAAGKRVIPRKSPAGSPVYAATGSHSGEVEVLRLTARARKPRHRVSSDAPRRP
jgi:DNA-binding NarL/FixJ family response regulator